MGTLPDAMTMVAWGCAAEPVDRTATETAPRSEGTGTAGTTTPEGTVRLADIAGAPNKYLGKTVTVVADVEEVFGPRAFALDEDAPLAGGIDSDVLVLSPKAGTLSDIDDKWLNNKVRATGTVGKLIVVEIEREIGWDLDRELEVEVEGADAVIIAKSVERQNP